VVLQTSSMAEHSTVKTKDPSKWSASDVFEWIKSESKIATYADQLLSEEVDGNSLLLLTNEDLHSIGINIGGRKKILRAILQLKSRQVNFLIYYIILPLRVTVPKFREHQKKSVILEIRANRFSELSFNIQNLNCPQ